MARKYLLKLPDKNTTVHPTKSVLHLIGRLTTPVVTVHCRFPVPGSEKLIGFVLEIASLCSRCPSFYVAVG